MDLPASIGTVAVGLCHLGLSWRAQRVATEVIEWPSALADAVRRSVRRAHVVGSLLGLLSALGGWATGLMLVAGGSLVLAVATAFLAALVVGRLVAAAAVWALIASWAMPVPYGDEVRAYPGWGRRAPRGRVTVADGRQVVEWIETNEAMRKASFINLPADPSDLWDQPLGNGVRPPRSLE